MKKTHPINPLLGGLIFKTLISADYSLQSGGQLPQMSDQSILPIARVYECISCYLASGGSILIGEGFEKELLSMKYSNRAWNATAAPGYFTEESLSLDPKVDVTDEMLTALSPSTVK